MKSIEVTSSIEKFGDVPNEVEFRIKASRASFQILSSGLYSNKIRAIIRELCCNAYDSHKAAGKADVPFQICLPDAYSPMLVIKDFGTGLSHDDVMTIYTTYFESTKNDSNDYIGQLGLGSKSPFSYTNQFLVESRYDGVSRSYSMFISEHGLPAVSLLGETPTEESNGMTITIAVKQTDFYKFREESEYVLKYFNPYPEITGTHYRQDFEYRVIKDTFAIRNEPAYNYSKPNVIQGFISYPIDVEQIRTYVSDTVSLTELGHAVVQTPIDLFMKIGEVQVAPSREHLSYDKQTIENIIKMLNAVGEEISLEFQSMIDSCETMFDARVLVHSFMDHQNVFRKIFDKMSDKNTTFTYEGNPVSPTIDLYSLDLPDNVYYYIYSKSRGYRSTNKASFIKLDNDNLTHYRKFGGRHHTIANVYATNGLHIIVCDEYAPVSIIRDYVGDVIGSDSSYIEVRPKKNEDITEATKNLLALAGLDADDYRVIYTSDMYAKEEIERVERKSRKQTVARAKEDRDVFCVPPRPSNVKVPISAIFQTQKVDLETEECFYVPTYRGNFIRDFSDFSKAKPSRFANLNLYLNFMREYCNLDLTNGVRIIKVNCRDSKKVLGNKKLVNFFDFANKMLVENYEVFCTDIIRNRRDTCIEHSWIEFIWMCVKTGKYSVKFEHEIFSKYFDIDKDNVDFERKNKYHLLDYSSLYSDYSHEISEDIKNAVSDSYFTIPQSELETIETETKKRYPLLCRLINRFWKNIDAANVVNDCVEYMNLVDEKILLSESKSEEEDTESGNKAKLYII